MVLDDLDAPLDDSELSFLANEEDRKYITGLQERLMIRKDGNLKEKDPCLKVISNLKGVSDDFKFLLDNMLKVNPYMRYSAKEVQESALLK